jgi:hypothetical protein
MRNQGNVLEDLMKMSIAWGRAVEKLLMPWRWVFKILLMLVDQWEVFFW